MSSFEEQFKELNVCKHKIKNVIGIVQNHHVVYIDDVEKFCLSKSKVREAIKRLRLTKGVTSGIAKYFNDRNIKKEDVDMELMNDAICYVFEKELGLEEEGK